MNLTVKDYKVIMDKLSVIADEVEEIQVGVDLPTYEWDLADDVILKAQEIQKLLTTVRFPAPRKGAKP